MSNGRPTKLTPDRHKRIVDLLRAGNQVNTAYQAAGVSETAYHNWISKGRGGEEPYREFAEDVERARADAVSRMVDVVVKAATEEKTWQAAAWFLPRANRRWMYGQPGRTDEQTLAPKDAAAARERQIERLEGLYKLAQQQNDTRTALAAMQDIGKLMGLYPTDQAALARAGLDSATSERQEEVVERVRSIASQLEEAVKNGRSGRGGGSERA